MRWTINKKLILGFIGVSILIGTAGGLGLLNVLKIKKATNIITYEEIPVTDSVSKMNSLLLINKNLIEMYKGATTAVPVYNDEILPELENQFQHNVDTFNLYATAVLNGLTIDGLNVLPTKNPELRKIIKHAVIEHISKFQTISMEVMENGKQMLTQKDMVVYSMKMIDDLYDHMQHLFITLEELVLMEGLFPGILNDIKGKRALLVELKFSLKEIALYGDVEKIDSFQKSFDKHISIFNTWSNEILNDTSLGPIKGIGKELNYSKFKDIIKELNLYFFEFEQTSMMLTMAEKELIDVNDRSDDAIKALDKTKEEMRLILMKAEGETKKKVKHAQLTTNKILRVAQFTLGLTTGIGTILGIAFGILYSRQITEKLNQLVKATQIISSGNMKHKVNVSSKDDIGLLADAFNNMVDKLQTTTLSRNYVDNILKCMADTLVVTSGGIISMVNKAACDLLEYEEQELIGSHIGLILWENIALFEKSMNASNMEMAYLSKNGRKITVSLSCSALIDDFGEVQGIICVAQDITERKRSEEKIRKLTKAVEQSPSMVVITDFAGNIEYVNPKSTLLTGYTFDEIVGQNPRIFNSGKQSSEVYKNLWQTIVSGEDWRGEFINKKKNGELYWEAASISAIRNSDNVITHFIKNAEDITRRKNAEEDLLKHHQRLEEIVEERTKELKTTYDKLLHAEKLSAVGKLSACISHEFNNPLSGIINVLERIRRKVVMNKSNKDFLDMAISECDRMTDLVSKLRDFYRPSTGNKTWIDINKTIDDVLLLLRKKLKTRNIILIKEYGSNVPEVYVVLDQIKQVILNLLNNAEQASGDDGGMIKVSTSVCKTELLINVEDAGCGISSEKKEVIFEPFFTTKGVKGTGLGLSVSYGIIKHHKGEINVTDRCESGTIFTVSLPLKNGETMP